MARFTASMTVVQHFTVTGGTEEFEKALDEYVRFRAGGRGCEAYLTVRLLDRPGGYVHLDRWENLESLLRVVHSDASPGHMRELGALAGFETALTVTVGRMKPGQEAVPARVVLVNAALDAEPSRFEQDFGALVGQCVLDEGFGGSDLLRSTVDPLSYVGLMWWWDEESCERGLHDEQFQPRWMKLADSARVVVERAVRIASA